MDMSSGSWLAELGDEDANTIIQHCEMMMMNNSNGNLLSSTKQATDFLFDETNDDLHIMTTLLDTNPESNKVIKAENDINWSSTYTTSSNNSAERIISFGTPMRDANTTNNPNNSNKHDLVKYESGTINSNYQNNSTSNNNNRVGSTSLCSQEHVLAERKRREKMSERFHALSALIPGLKKMDKATILGDAAKYVKQLEEQIKKQEEQITKKTVESVVLVKKSNQHLNNNGDYTSSSSNSAEMVEIESKISNKNVLIRVHSQKKEGLLQFLLNEIGNNLHLSILNCITMPFGSYAVDITVIAEIDNKEVRMTSNNIVEHLGLALQQFTSL